jgi:hypothetical protein
MTLVLKRSALKMWLMAMAGIPLLVISLDVLTNRRITNWLREIVFRPEDTQIYEPRDVIWAWAMALFAGFIVLWGLKELFIPTKVIECRDEGLALKLSGPFRQPSLIPWADIDDVTGGQIDDEGDVVPLLLISVLRREGLPVNPWGARWVKDDQLGVLAEDWSEDPRAVADEIVECAVAAARKEKRDRADRMAASLEEE